MISKTFLAPIDSKAHAAADPVEKVGRRTLWGGGLLILLGLFGWWSLIVHANYQGDWSALFLHGRVVGVPQTLQNLPVASTSERGFDGQFYRFIAHDPLLRADTEAYLDLPRLRYGRPLIPLAAHVAGFGRSQWIDGAYFLVIGLFLAAGAYWTVRAMQSGHGRGALLFGLAFLALPSSIISIQRMTIDIGLAACTAAYVASLRSGSQWAVWGSLAAACLCRETGVLLVGGHCLWLASWQQWRNLLVIGSALLPWVGWQWHAAELTPPHPVLSSGFMPFRAYWELAMEPLEFARQPALSYLARLFDWLSLLGVTLAVGLGLRNWKWRSAEPFGWAAMLFAVLGLLLLGESDWHRGYDLGRVLSPLLALLLMLPSPVPAQRMRWAWAPLLLTLPRYSILIGSELLTLAR